MTADRWALTLAGLRGERWPLPADIPGRLIRAADRPLTDDELAGVDSATELGLLLGISRQAAFQRLKRAATAQKGQP